MRVSNRRKFEDDIYVAVGTENGLMKENRKEKDKYESHG